MRMFMIYLCYIYFIKGERLALNIGYSFNFLL